MADEKKKQTSKENKADRRVQRAGANQYAQASRNPMAGAISNAFGNDRELTRGGLGGYSLAEQMFGNAFGTLDPTDQNEMVSRFRNAYDSFAQPSQYAEDAYNQATQDAASMRSQIPGLDNDIQRSLGALGGFNSDVNMARQLIDRAWNQRDPQAQQTLNMMMQRSQGYSPEERALMLDTQRTELLNSQQQQLAQALGQMGARGQRGGVASAFQANQGQALGDAMRQAGRDVSLSSLQRGDQMLGNAGQFMSQLLQNEVANRNAAQNQYNAATGAYAQGEATLAGQRGLRQNILQQAADTMNKASSARTGAEQVRGQNMQGMGSLYNTAQDTRNNMEMFNIGQGLNRQLALYQGLLSGAANVAQNRAQRQQFELGQRWIDSQQNIANTAANASIAAAKAGAPQTTYNVTTTGV